MAANFCKFFNGITLRSLNLCSTISSIALAALLFWVPEPAQAGYASIVVNADSGRILHATNADTRNYPASLTKMMTLFMMFEALDVGKWTLNTKLKISARAARQPASRLGLKRGQMITVKDAILALVTKSANDVATTVAENIALWAPGITPGDIQPAAELSRAHHFIQDWPDGYAHRITERGGNLSSGQRQLISIARALARPQSVHYIGPQQRRAPQPANSGAVPTVL